MTERIGRDELARMIAGAASRIRQEHQRLSQLDSAAGDGDHGTTMLRTVDRLEQTVQHHASVQCKDILLDAGWAVLGVDGGASSSLLGTFFAGMADAPCDVLDCRGLADSFEAGLGAVSKQTKAQPGDKTMMDALVPAVRAFRAAAGTGKCIADALSDAAQAALTGAENTRDLVARYGRARHLGEKVRGHQDPGATSMALLFQGFYDALAESKGESNA